MSFHVMSFMKQINGVANELAKRGWEHQCSVREYNKCPIFFFNVKYVRDILQLGTPRECPIDNTCNSAP